MQSSPARRRAAQLHVTIVSTNPETLDGLETYLRRAGLKTSGTRTVEGLADRAAPLPSVVVLFPDDFRPESVVAALLALRAQRPKTLPVLVTKEPQRFEALPARSAGGLAPLVIPKPVWGWTILDAIRSRLDAEGLQVR